MTLLPSQTNRPVAGTEALRNLFPGLRDAIYFDVAARSPLNVLAGQAADDYLAAALVGGNKQAMFAGIE